MPAAGSGDSSAVSSSWLSRAPFSVRSPLRITQSGLSLSISSTKAAAICGVYWVTFPSDARTMRISVERSCASRGDR